MCEVKRPNAIKATVYLSCGDERVSYGESVVRFPMRAIEYEEFVAEIMDETVKRFLRDVKRMEQAPSMLVELFPITVGDPNNLRSMSGSGYFSSFNDPYLTWVDDKEGVDTRNG